jgi:nitrilase
MPLARAAMYAQGVTIYLAPTWDNSEVWVPTLRHIAKEGRVYVLGVAPVLHGGHVPQELRGDLYAGTGDWMSRGHSAIAGPDGQLIAGPVTDTEEILYAEADPRAVLAARREFDPVGHYARPDVFHLSVDTTPRRPVSFLAVDDRPPAPSR